MYVCTVGRSIGRSVGSGRVRSSWGSRRVWSGWLAEGGGLAGCLPTGWVGALYVYSPLVGWDHMTVQKPEVSSQVFTRVSQLPSHHAPTIKIKNRRGGWLEETHEETETRRRVARKHFSSRRKSECEVSVKRSV